MRIAWTEIPGLFKAAAADWSEDKASRLAAALAYYTIFSLAPLLMISIAVAGAVFGEEAARGQIVGQIEEMVGKTGAEAIQAMIEHASRPGSGGVLATVIGVVILLFGASGIFAALQDALNTIWEVAPKPDSTIWDAVKSRIFSFGMVFGVGFLLLASLLLSAALSAAGSMLGSFLSENELVLQLINFAVSFAVITVLFAAIYKYLPDVKIQWSHVWFGAVVTSLLFAIGKLLIGLYLGHSSTASAYGAAGSLVVLLVWIYYSAQIFLFGAEFTQVYAARQGSAKVPKGNAVSLTLEMKTQQGIPPVESVPSPAQAVTAKPVAKKSSVGRAFSVVRTAVGYYLAARKQLKRQRAKH